MKCSFFALLCLLLIFLPLKAQAQTSGEFVIKGQVIDSLSNETVPYATISIASATTPQKSLKLLACDIDGKFETDLKNAGKYILSLQSIGKVPTKKNFTLSAKKKVLDLGILYMHDDSKQLGEVTVTAQRKLVKVELDKLTYSLDEDPEAQTSNTLDMLRKVPMITVDGNDEIQLQGSTNFKIYVNGKPSNMMNNNPADVLKSMPANSVKDIEVITDPGAKYDAEGVGGIINIITTRNVLEGYTASINADASVLGRMGAGAYVSAKFGKFGLTGNYKYNHENSPWSESYSIRETYASGTNPATLLNQYGRSKRQGPFQFGYLEGSYEIDSLNLLSVGVNLFRGDATNKTEYDVTMMDGSDLSNFVYGFDRNSSSTSVFGSTDVNVDYQHSTHKKDELLTFSYRFSHTPNNNESYTDLENIEGVYPQDDLYPRWDINDAASAEHTAQIDYTTPLWKDHTLEVGAKYIFRQSDSETLRQYYNDSTNVWDAEYDANSDFRHNQHIYSAYLGYTVKVDKLGIKAGARAEGTSLNAHFAYEPDMDFSTSYFNVVPNLTLSYQINMAQQIRIGYNMRIRRPSIWNLNPYVNTTDPENISYGNPNLDPEKSNRLHMNYSFFNSKFNFNANLSYRFENNAIEQIVKMNNGVSETTYDNIGKSKRVGLSLYASYTPIPLLRIMFNGGADYSDLSSSEMALGNTGFSGRMFTGVQFNLPKDFRVDLRGGYFSPRISLQGKRSPMYFTDFAINKSFLKKKLTVSLTCRNPFWKTIKMESTTEDPAFDMTTVNYMRARDFRISVTYRFGTLKDAIKKVKRGISNDDVDSNNGGGNEGMM